MKLSLKITILMLVLMVGVGGLIWVFLASEGFGYYQFFDALKIESAKHQIVINGRRPLDMDMGSDTLKQRITVLAYEMFRRRGGVSFDKRYKTGIQVSDGTNSMFITIWGHDEEVFGVEGEYVGDKREKGVFDAILHTAKQNAKN